MDCTERYISLELAKKAKLSGFALGSDHTVIEYHVTHKHSNPSFSMTEGEVEYDSTYMVNNGIGDISNINYTIYERPTLSRLREWLMYEHGIYIELLLDGWLKEDADLVTGDFIHYTAFIYVVGERPPKPQDDLGGAAFHIILEVALNSALDILLSRNKKI